MLMKRRAPELEQWRFDRSAVLGIFVEWLHFVEDFNFTKQEFSFNQPSLMAVAAQCDVNAYVQICFWEWKTWWVVLPKYFGVDGMGIRLSQDISYYYDFIWKTFR